MVEVETTRTFVTKLAEDFRFMNTVGFALLDQQVPLAGDQWEELATRAFELYTILPHEKTLTIWYDVLQRGIKDWTTYVRGLHQNQVKGAARMSHTVDVAHFWSERSDAARWKKLIADAFRTEIFSAKQRVELALPYQEGYEAFLAMQVQLAGWTCNRGQIYEVVTRDGVIEDILMARFPHDPSARVAMRAEITNRLMEPYAGPSGDR